MTAIERRARPIGSATTADTRASRDGRESTSPKPPTASTRGSCGAYNRNGYSPYVHRITTPAQSRSKCGGRGRGGDKGGGQTHRNQGGGGGGGGNCSRAYPDFCIPPPPPDRDCDDINGQNFTVRSPDPHGSTATAMESALDLVSAKTETDLQLQLSVPRGLMKCRLA
jgi:hypothetical protein